MTLLAASLCASMPAQASPAALSGQCVFAPVEAESGTAFGPEKIIRLYPSDLPARGTYISLLDQFSTLATEHPEVIEQNLGTTIAINNSASAAEQQRAISDNYNDPASELAESLGSALGEQYISALKSGKLPKVRALIDGAVARAGLLMSSTVIEKAFYSNPRPFVAAPESIQHYDRENGSIYQAVSLPGTDGSYPSGHTTQAYWKAFFLASWLPELGPQILDRASEAGHSRIILGVHYPLDVMGGRMMGSAAAADRMSDPEFLPLVQEAGAELRTVLEQQIGTDLNTFIECHDKYKSTSDSVADYRERMTYGFTRLSDADTEVDVPWEAAALLRPAHPELTDEQLIQVLQQTALTAGYPLDKTGPQGGWQRLDFATAWVAQVSIDIDGNAVVQN
ncbi:MAG: acid phosphatase [Mycobacteriaceae bacterium]